MPELTPEQIQLREERARQKAEKALQQPVNDTSGKILKREWIQIHPRPAFAVKIMTWNVRLFFPFATIDSMSDVWLYDLDLGKGLGP